ncbi:MAG: FxsA family protein [Candidatus Phosphoribacter sp.]|nr:FxsA family protein [Actinomycetales bacterium]
MAQRVTSARRRRRWPWVFTVALLVVPTLEIALIVWVGQQIGGWPTLALLVLESALGAWLVKREGARTWSALARALSSGRMPSRQLTDAALVLVGGTLLLTPGFLTDVVGFFFILPTTRPLARAVLETIVTRKLLGGLVAEAARPGDQTGPGGRDRGRPRPNGHEVIEGEIVDE